MLCWRSTYSSSAKAWRSWSRLGLRHGLPLRCSISPVGRPSSVKHWPRTGPDPQLAADLPIGSVGQGCGIACSLLADVGVPGALLEAVSRLLSAARAELGEEADYLEAIKLVERAAGTEIRG